MGEQPSLDAVAKMGRDGRVAAADVLTLRRSVFANGLVEREELDAVFALAARAPEGDPEWPQFFCEAVADYYLREEQPNGYLTDAEFDDLKSRVHAHGCANPLERLLLVKLMETAVKTPDAYSRWVGEQLKQSILTKAQGPVVEKDDVVLLRRYLFAAGGAGNVAVTRHEAELLFDINDAVQNAPNNPGWAELFVQGVVNHLMAHLGYAAPSREEAFRRDAWARDHSVNLGGFFRRMVSGGFSAFKSAEKSVYAQKAEERDAGAAVAARVAPAEADWLAERIGKDGAFDKNERRLIERMRELENDLPDNLKALVERAA